MLGAFHARLYVSQQEVSPIESRVAHNKGLVFLLKCFTAADSDNVTVVDLMNLSVSLLV